MDGWFDFINRRPWRPSPAYSCVSAIFKPPPCSLLGDLGAVGSGHWIVKKIANQAKKNKQFLKCNLSIAAASMFRFESKEAACRAALLTKIT